MNSYLGKKALVWGYGVSGKAAAHFLLENGTKVTILDQKEKDKSLKHSIPFFSEEESFPMNGFDFCVKSPGISPFHPLYQKISNCMPITSEIEIACHSLTERNKKLLGISGSNGKTTTTLLTAHVLQSNGKKALAVGNVGIPLISQVKEDIDIFVIELSSFQIEMLKGSFFNSAVILNITPNHLDRYQSFEEYADAKLHLRDCLKKEGTFYIQETAFRQFQDRLKNLSVNFLPSIQEKIETIFQLSYRNGGIRFATHDIENFQAAYALCLEENIPEEDIWKGAMTFQKPPHRLQLIYERGGVVYINDSKATSVDAMMKAVEAIDFPIILIAGGVDKGGSFMECGSLFQRKVKCIFAFGKASFRIHQELGKFITVNIQENLEKALNCAEQCAQKGDTILFSPGCSSYDQYKDYQERGEHFKKLVLR
jgi:UDP-N-acetylmuramoylalanine--D-glutamate ligase